MQPRIPKPQLARARKMRREQTFSEEMLWRELRDRKLGVKFRRQMPVGPFIADFACVEAKVVVEVDGPSHETEAGQAHDQRRDAWFLAQGWQVVRVTNEIVTGGGEMALEAIRTAVADDPARAFSRLREKVSRRSRDG